MLHENNPHGQTWRIGFQNKGNSEVSKSKNQASVIAFLRCSNANYAFGFHIKQSLCSKAVKGEVITAYPLISLR